MKIAVCDDDTYYRGQLQELTKTYASTNREREITVSTFTHAEQLLESVYKNGGFDIYILDIVMPGMNGIELGRQLRNDGYDGKIIYLTTSDEFAIDSYSVDTFNYILKPWDNDHFLSTLERAVCSISDRKEKHIMVKTKESNVKLNLDAITHAELSKRCVIYHLTSGRIVESTTLRTNFAEAMQPLVSEKRFIFCGASTVANMHHITEVENEAVIFSCGEKIFFSKKICRDIRTAWLDFCFSEVDDI